MGLKRLRNHYSTPCFCADSQFIIPLFLLIKIILSKFNKHN